MSTAYSIGTRPSGGSPGIGGFTGAAVEDEIASLATETTTGVVLEAHTGIARVTVLFATDLALID